MSELMKLIQDADIAAVELENARVQVEAAKQSLETAKESHEKARAFLDEVLGKADQVGVPRAKIRKLIEERTQALVASGLLPNGSDLKSATLKAPRSSRKSKVVSDEIENEDPSSMMTIEEIEDEHQAIQLN